jgi:hypothetical protein
MLGDGALAFGEFVSRELPLDAWDEIVASEILPEDDSY